MNGGTIARKKLLAMIYCPRLLFHIQIHRFKTIKHISYDFILDQRWIHSLAILKCFFACYQPI